MPTSSTTTSRTLRPKQSHPRHHSPATVPATDDEPTQKRLKTDNDHTATSQDSTSTEGTMEPTQERTTAVAPTQTPHAVPTGDTTDPPHTTPTTTMDTVTISYVPPIFVPRLNHAFDYQFVRGSRFRLTNVPTKTTWSGWRDKWLSADRKIISVCFVCQLMSLDMYDTVPSRPKPYANIHFRFIRTADYDAARHVTYEMSSPPSSSRKQTFAASCPTKKQGSVFDGTVLFGQKSTMPKISPSDLECNDLLLVEARVQRYHPDPDPTYPQGWQSTFYLESITRLLPAPDDAPDAVESDRDDGRIDTDDEGDVF